MMRSSFASGFRRKKKVAIESIQYGVIIHSVAVVN